MAIKSERSVAHPRCSQKHRFTFSSFMPILVVKCCWGRGGRAEAQSGRRLLGFYPKPVQVIYSCSRNPSEMRGDVPHLGQERCHRDAESIPSGPRWFTAAELILALAAAPTKSPCTIPGLCSSRGGENLSHWGFFCRLGETRGCSTISGLSSC